MQNKIIAVAGPTASGKTALAIEISKRFHGEVVSCDSMQIYRGMDIGTAKPSKAEMCGIPHHMIDIAEPDERYSVAEFVKAARACIDDILARGRLPVLAGGTGLYMDSIINNTDFAEQKSDGKFRGELQQYAEKHGVDALHAMLAERDPEAAEKIHPNNIRRVIRALEVCHLTGKTFTQVNREALREPIYDALIFGLEMPRDVLYGRINERVDRMMSEGLEDEVRRLYDSGIDPDCTAMQAIGYKELAEYFRGESGRDEAIEKIKRESRRYAKRQLTWFKRNPKIIWLMLQDCYSLNKIREKCFTFINKFGIIE